MTSGYIVISTLGNIPAVGQTSCDTKVGVGGVCWQLPGSGQIR